MGTFIEGSYVAKLVWILILTILSTIWISSQIIMVHGVPVTTTPLVVKITSPHKGQKVGIGQNITLLGSSNYNTSSKCQVSIIVDKKRPYQDTIPLGQGADNYSQWKYTLSPSYTALTEGVNRVTAKLTCNANPALTKSYSINLTGVNQPTTTTPQPSQQQITIKSNGTISPFSPASALSNSTLNRANTTSVIPVSANSSSLIDPSSTHASSSPSGGHSHTHHPSHHTHHSSSSSEHNHSHTHTGSDSHNSDNGGHGSDSHHGDGGGNDFFHGAFSHFGHDFFHGE